VVDPPLHGAVAPEIALGCPGAFELATDRALEGETPQLLLAITLMVPANGPGLTEIVLVVDVPDQPLGNDQV
jgi:hypothetical protein